jgi:hypothetical protein
MNKATLFHSAVKMAHEPVDLAAGAITGARIHAGKGERITVLAILAASVAAATVQFTLRQHNAAVAGTSKDVSVANNYFVKKAAETEFTKFTPVAAQALYDLGALIDTGKAVVAFEVLPEQLDVNGGFNHFSVDLADAGVGAKLISTMYIVEDSKLKPAYLETL